MFNADSMLVVKSWIMQVQPALDFLLGLGLGDLDADVREHMVNAGAPSLHGLLLCSAACSAAH